MKVLVVDDSRTARHILSAALRECVPEPLEIVEACDGREGVSRYLESRPDLVFMDLTMPVMDGYEAVSVLLENDPDARVIVLSADVQPLAKSRILELGALVFAEKPIEVERLRELLEEVAPTQKLL